MQVKETREILSTIVSTWPVLEKLYSLDRQITISDLAKDVKASKSIISKNIKSLEEIRPEILLIDLQPRNGRDYKLVQLTGHAHVLVDAIVKFAKSSPPEEQSEVPAKDISDAIEHVLTGKTPEIREIGWLDLQSYVLNSKLWKNEKIWSIIEPRVMVDTPGDEFNKAFSIYTKMLAKAFEGEKEKNPVAKRARMKHLSWLKEVMKSKDRRWGDRRHEIMGLFKYIMREVEWLGLFWDVWVTGAREISDNGEYEAFVIPFSSYLRTNNHEMVKSFREQLFVLLEDSDERMRPRASNMYRMIFH